MPLERESTRLFREARRARRLGGGESAASALGTMAAKVASMEPTGIRKYSERIAQESMNKDILRQTAAIQAGFTPTGTRKASGNVLNSRQNLFKQMQGAKTREEAESLFGSAQSLGVTRSGFDQALLKVSANFDTPAPTTAVAGGPPTVKPAGPTTATPTPAVKTVLTEQQKRMKFYEDQRRSRLGLPPLS